MSPWDRCMTRHPEAIAIARTYLPNLAKPICRPMIEGGDPSHAAGWPILPATFKSRQGNLPWLWMPPCKGMSIWSVFAFGYIIHRIVAPVNPRHGGDHGLMSGRLSPSTTFVNSPTLSSRASAPVDSEHPKVWSNRDNSSAELWDWRIADARQGLARGKASATGLRQAKPLKLPTVGRQADNNDGNLDIGSQEHGIRDPMSGEIGRQAGGQRRNWMEIFVDVCSAVISTECIPGLCNSKVIADRA
ncbi:hypothetical protein CALVIDRAFT_556511 [Calocera viscosa TUFC12733]|uniref:Uncharacterized protein n=1 Tax=Calocera viscosa (strain TUFC12733) TaxID=1330018 RepID=A0A167K3G9_CALVF|nr:hypothetical protein CALVIDRAFT_556511 [Calocera viscosa TUFC12733]